MNDNREIRRVNARFSDRDRVHRGTAHPIWLISALLALAIQILVVQTHVHGNGAWPGISSAQGVSADGANTDRIHHPDKFPIKDDPSNCPLCQEFSLSGGYLHSVQIAILAPSSSIGERPFVFESGEPRQHVSHPWFGRAPPREAAHA
jgi:hypothetical protein